MFYVLGPKIYGHLMLNCRQHVPACWPCYELPSHTPPPGPCPPTRSITYTWHSLQVSRALSLTLSLSLLSSTCFAYCLYFSAVLFMQSPDRAAGAAASTRLLRCPLPSAFDILHIRFILQLQYLICSYHANFHPSPAVSVLPVLPCSS